MAGSYGFVAGYTPTSDDVYPMAFPITHIGGVAIVTASLLTGLRLVMVAVFDAEQSPLMMAEHDATFLGSALPFFQAYMAAQRKHGPEQLFPRLRSCVGGGAPNSPELHREVQEVLGGRGRVLELGSHGVPGRDRAVARRHRRAAEHHRRPPSPGVQMRVIAPDGRDCAPDEPGELCLYGPQISCGRTPTPT